MNRAFIAVTILCTALSGCSWGDGGNNDAFFACPQTGFVREASRATFFMPDAPAQTDENVVAWVVIDGLTGECEFDDGRVEIKTEFTLYAKRGPAGEGMEETGFNYFAAVLDERDDVLNRESLRTEIEFDENLGSSDESLTIEIPVKPGVDTGAYKVVIGLELSEAQLEYNRKGPAGP